MTPRLKATLAALCASLLGAACGELGRPAVSPSGPSLTATADGSGGRIVLTSAALRAGKRLPGGQVSTETDSELISKSRGGSLSVRFGGRGPGKGEVAVQKASLRIDRNSIGGDVTPEWGDSYRITMEVSSGTTLDDVNVVFSPGGMVFSPAAELEVVLSGQANFGALVAYHVSSDGSVSKLGVKVEQLRGAYKVRVEVRGFSRYSWDDGGE